MSGESDRGGWLGWWASDVEGGRWRRCEEVVVGVREGGEAEFMGPVLVPAGLVPPHSVSVTCDVLPSSPDLPGGVLLQFPPVGILPLPDFITNLPLNSWLLLVPRVEDPSHLVGP